ncbi:hypothetical protein Pla110_03490 [Polystyrenella longa]|uniref:Alpha/beta hydrolase family protein n=1 Tax=Polystyrenella longa TaxID=2528007 RepID=A0A518CHD8_9PLAN|nr:alpha/beta hydrolase [Polystyrenella longa]QDU78645.1 hypothetical protein Pla110_03490 [Polystyrenella longa]
MTYWGNIKNGSPMGLSIAFSLSLAFFYMATPVFADDVPFEEARTFTTEDGWTLKGTYYNMRFDDPNEGVQRPVVLLLPGDRGNRLHWEGQAGFASTLRNSGYAVLTLDPRKYGESTPPANVKNVVKEMRPADYADVLRYDLEAVKLFLFEEHQQKNLNMAKLAIIAPESLAPVAMGFTVRDWKKVPYRDAATLDSRTPRGQDVKALVVISPEVNLPGISGKSALLQLRRPFYDVAIMTVAGDNDKTGKESSDLIYTYLTGNKESDKDDMRMFYKKIYPKYGDRGTELISRNQQMATDILEFLNSHVLKKSIPWQDRRSRFER